MHCTVFVFFSHFTTPYCTTTYSIVFVFFSHFTTPYGTTTYSIVFVFCIVLHCIVAPAGFRPLPPHNKEMCLYRMQKHLDLKKLGTQGNLGKVRKVVLGNSCNTRSFMHHPVFHVFCLVNPVASLGFAQVAVIIFQCEYFVSHRFPGFFKIKKLFSSTRIFRQRT